jgi:hypothetical protein
MMTVSSGRSITDIWEYLEEHGSKNTIYASNISGLDQFCSMLSKEIVDVEEHPPIQWIRSMTLEKVAERPSAAKLYRTICRMSGKFIFVGTCCMSDDDVQSFHSASSIESKPKEISHRKDSAALKHTVPSKERIVQRVESSTLAQHMRDAREPMYRRASNDMFTPVVTPSEAAFSTSTTVSRSVSASTVPSASGTVTPRVFEQIRRTSQIPIERPTSVNSGVGSTTSGYDNAAVRRATIPWSQLFDVSKLPLADGGLWSSNKSPPPRSFVDEKAFSNVCVVLSSHFNDNERVTDIKEVKENPVLEMTMICSILHLMNRPDLLDNFLDYSDDDLKFTLAKLKTFLPEDAAIDFEEAQHCIHQFVRNFDPDPEIVTQFEDNELLPLRSIEDLGKGGWGKVDRVELLSGPRTPVTGQVARKTLPVMSMSLDHEKDYRKTFKRELNNLRKLSSHQHIVQLLCAYETPHTLGLLLSPIATCDLNQYLESPRQYVKLGKPKSVLGQAFGCLASALNFIHENKSKPLPVLLNNCKY